MSTLALFVALGGGAFAASGFIASGGVVRLCVARSGAVKVLKNRQKCGKGKAQIPVNQKGQTGAKGPQGAPGQQGPQGPPGPASGGGSYSAGNGLALNGSTFSADLSQLQARVGSCASDHLLQSVSQAGTPTCVLNHAYFNQGTLFSTGDTATVNVPAGGWVVIAEDSIAPNSADQIVTCTIELNGNPATPIGAGSQHQAVSGQDTNVTAIGVTTTTSSSTPIVALCKPNSAAIAASIGASIIAIPVAALN